MSDLYKKHVLFYLTFALILLLANVAAVFIGLSVVKIALLNSSLFGTALVFISLSALHAIKTVEKEGELSKDRLEKEYEQSIINIYDEHIFAITHELRSPLAVVASSCLNINNNLKNTYNEHPNKDEMMIVQRFRNMKRSIQNVQSQIEIIEDFISLISEHASYVNDDKKTEKIINIHSYLISILLNAPSYSMNMRIFANNIKFSDDVGADFEGIQTVVNPHDLSRIIMNICTNSADAVLSAYKTKKENNKSYEPKLMFKCYKSENPNVKVFLPRKYRPIGEMKPGGYSFYLIISDNGPGISEDNIEKIFKKGFSTKKKNTNAHHGLGLHITLQLAKRNNLCIFLNTDASGTEFAIGFPEVIYDEEYWKSPGTSTALFNRLIFQGNFKEKDLEPQKEHQVFPDDDSDSRITLIRKPN